MLTDTDNERLQSILQMFTEFSKGNFAFRIPERGRKSYLDALIIYYNLLGFEIETFLLRHNSTKMHSGKVIQDAQLLSDYILLHLEEPLPTIRALSKMFHTNERKLKEGFRALFNTSIYQFYHVERLKKAQLLILRTDKSLKSIACRCGFNTYHNFSTAFKKHFGQSPVTLRQRS